MHDGFHLSLLTLYIFKTISRPEFCTEYIKIIDKKCSDYSILIIFLGGGSNSVIYLFLKENGPEYSGRT